MMIINGDDVEKIVIEILYGMYGNFVINMLIYQN